MITVICERLLMYWQWHSDLTLCGHWGSHPCHKAVLVARSQYFKTMFASGMVEATSGVVKWETDGLTLDVVKKVLTFMYLNH